MYRPFVDLGFGGFAGAFPLVFTALSAPEDMSAEMLRAILKGSNATTSPGRTQTTRVLQEGFRRSNTEQDATELAYSSAS